MVSVSCKGPIPPRSWELQSFRKRVHSQSCLDMWLMLSSLTVAPQVTPKAVSDHKIHDVLQIYILSCWVLCTKTRWLPIYNLHQRHFSESPYNASSLALLHIVCVFENNLWLSDKSERIVVALVWQNSDISAILAYSSIAGSKYLTPSLSARDLTWLVCGLGSYLKAIDRVWIVFEIFILYPWKGRSILFPQEYTSFSMLWRPPCDVLRLLFPSHCHLCLWDRSSGTCPRATPGSWSPRSLAEKRAACSWLASTYLPPKGTVFPKCPQTHSLTEREADNTRVECVLIFFFFFNLSTDELLVPIYKVALRMCADGHASPTLFSWFEN